MVVSRVVQIKWKCLFNMITSKNIPVSKKMETNDHSVWRLCETVCDKFQCVKQEQTSLKEAHLGKVKAKYEVTKTKAMYAELTGKITNRRGYCSLKISKKNNWPSAWILFLFSKKLQRRCPIYTIFYFTQVVCCWGFCRLLHMALVRQLF